MPPDSATALVIGGNGMVPEFSDVTFNGPMSPEVIVVFILCVP